MLPPFHSFGITVTTILPLCAGLRTVYHPNPTEAAVLARVIAAYRVTVLVGTPTFLNGIVRAAQPGQLDSLRFAVTGAEKCPAAVYDALRQRVPARDASSRATASPSARRSCRRTGRRSRSPGASAGRSPRSSAPSSASRADDAVRRGETGHAARARARASSAGTSTTRASRRSSSGTGSVVPHRRPGAAGRVGLAVLRGPAEALRQARRRDDLRCRPSRRCCCRTSARRPTRARRSRWRQSARPTVPEIVLFSVRATDRERGQPADPRRRPERAPQRPRGHPGRRHSRAGHRQDRLPWAEGSSSRRAAGRVTWVGTSTRKRSQSSAQRPRVSSLA